jgi:hypothetical protein
MASVYVVIENGDPYPEVYKTYNEAASAAKMKYKEMIDNNINEMKGHPESIQSIIDNIEVPENKDGTTYLYVEKGIHIYIYKLPIKASGGSRSSRNSRSSKSKSRSKNSHK